jgi:hypothetical protein
MKQLIRPFLAGVVCFAVIYGCLWVVGFLIEGAFKSSFGRSDILAVTDSTSPSHQYVATTFTDMGGGAAGWCYRMVTVRKTEEPFDPKENQVFSLQCNTDVEVAWKDDRNLLIAFSKDPVSMSLYQKSWTDDEAVRIVFATKTKVAAAWR